MEKLRIYNLKGALFVQAVKTVTQVMPYGRKLCIRTEHLNLWDLQEILWCLLKSHNFSNEYVWGIPTYFSAFNKAKLDKLEGNKQEDIW